MTALSRALMTSWPVFPPISSRATASAISSGVTNSICSPVVMVLNSSREKMPFSPVSMKTLFRLWPVGLPRAGSRGRKARPGRRGSESSSDTSCSDTGRPPRRISPKPMRFQAMAAAGLISLMMGPPGVRAMRKSRSECAPARALLERTSRDGLSSEWVYGMLRPMPPVPEVPIFT